MKDFSSLAECLSDDSEFRIGILSNDVFTDVFRNADEEVSGR